MSRKNQDTHIYYNVNIEHDDNNNPNSLPTLAKFSETRTVPIVVNPKNYYVSIVRFRVPTQTIPLFNFTPIVYKVGLRDITSGNLYTESLVYVPQITTPVDVVGDFPEPVNSYQQMLDYANTAFALATTALNAGETKTLSPPKYTYNPETELFSLIVPKDFIGSAEPYNNRPMYNFFLGSFNVLENNSTIFSGDNVFTYIVQDTSTNTFSATEFEFKQEFSTIQHWNGFKQLVFIAGATPIRNELIDSRVPSSNSTAQDNFQAIFTDFEPLESENNRSVVQYFAGGEYRFTDLTTNQPLKRMDLQVFWRDNENKLTPVTIPAHDSVNIKFLFRRRDF